MTTVIQIIPTELWPEVVLSGVFRKTGNAAPRAALPAPL